MTNRSEAGTQDGERKDADAVGDCVFFNIKDNDARLIAYINYEMGTVTVLAVLTHKEYDKGALKNACNC
jgi:mRNA-degrading endonuclease HigB of HigAB toxin-antitoxin module